MTDNDKIFIKRLNTLGGTKFDVLPTSLPIEIDTDLQHPNCPGGINVRASLLINVHSEHKEFKEWALLVITDKVTLSEFAHLLQNEDYGLASYLQKLINGVTNIGLVLRYGKEAVSWEPHDDVLPAWIEIKKLQYFNAKVLQTEDERQQEEFLKKIQLQQQQNEIDKIAAENEAAKKEIEARAELAELKHQNDVQNEILEQEIKSLQYELEKDRLKKHAEFEEDELKLKLDRLQLEKIAAATNNELLQKQIEEKNCNIQLIAIQTELAETKCESERGKLKIFETYVSEIRQEHRENIKLLDGICQKIHNAVDAGNKQNENFEKLLSNQMQNFNHALNEMTGKCEEMLCKAPSSPDDLIDVVRTQQKMHSVELKKIYARQENIVSPRGLGIGGFKSAAVKIGDEITFSFKSDISGYLTIINFSEHILLIAPNFVDGVCKVDANRTYSFPGEEFLPGLRVCQEKPAGKEQLLIIISKESLEDFFYQPHSGDGFDIVQPEQLRRIIKRLQTFSKDSWAAGYLSYTVVE
ncbi:MAG: DUF4384 domain-containing protein [Lentisphaeria bacterium]|nr:DUF4384 domain-containing protein [Lentisphaeria bacterium]